jgi:hypothetical protein
MGRGYAPSVSLVAVVHAVEVLMSFADSDVKEAGTEIDLDYLVRRGNRDDNLRC